MNGSEATPDATHPMRCCLIRGVFLSEGCICHANRIANVAFETRRADAVASWAAVCVGARTAPEARSFQVRALSFPLVARREALVNYILSASIDREETRAHGQSFVSFLFGEMR